MLALLTLNKLIKLEFKALDALAIKLHLSTDLYGKEMAQFANKVNQYIFKNFVEYRYDEIHSYHIYGGMREGDDFILSLPLPVLSTTTAANPNRFVKSSFALSLLWVAKFYSSIGHSYKRVTENCLCAMSTLDYVLIPYARMFTGLNHCYSWSFPNTYKYLQPRW